MVTIAMFFDEVGRNAAVIIANNCVGFTTDKVKNGDVVALLHGANEPVILRPCGENYCMIGLGTIAGMPDHAWPLTGNEDGIQRINLV